MRLFTDRRQKKKEIMYLELLYGEFPVAYIIRIT